MPCGYIWRHEFRIPPPFSIEERMRKITAGTIALLVVAFGAHFALAASNQVYTTAPTTFEGLAPVKRKSQNNTFSATVTCTILTATAHRANIAT